VCVEGATRAPFAAGLHLMWCFRLRVVVDYPEIWRVSQALLG